MYATFNPVDMVTERCGARARFSRTGAIAAITNTVDLTPEVARILNVEDTPFVKGCTGVPAMLRTETVIGDATYHDKRAIDTFIGSFTGTINHTNPDPWLIPIGADGPIEDLVEFHVWLHTKLTNGTIPPIMRAAAVTAA